MSKKESYRNTLNRLLNDFLKTGNQQKIVEYLSSNSSLPGPRGNLELAHAFAEAADNSSAENPATIWKLATMLMSISPEEAPVNNPKEFLPFCGAVAVGAIASTHKELLQRAFHLLKNLANDPRWRTREGVAMGIQRLIAKQGQNSLSELEKWVTDEEWLAMRAVAAGVAETALLTEKKVAEHALVLHKKTVSQILASGERKSSEFRILRQALGYSLSVVIRATPKAGFEYLQQLADSHDADIQWVIKENLKKNRLTKNFPREVEAVKKLLS